MKNSKIILYLSTLSKSEIRELEHIVRINAIKGSKDIGAFFNYLKRCYPNFSEKKINKESILKKVFPKDVNNHKKLENVQYKFGLLLENFLIQKELEHCEKERQFVMLKALKRRKLDQHFFKKIDQIEKDWTNKGRAGVDHLHDIYQLKKIRLLHPNYDDKHDLAIDPQILIEQLEKYFFAAKMYWMLSQSATHGYIQNTKSPSAPNPTYPIENILEFVAQNDFLQLPQIKLFGQILQASQGENFDNYPQLKKDFEQYSHLYDQDEKGDLIIFLTKICYEKYRKGEAEALQDLFEINRFAVEQNIVLQDGYVSSDVFQNIVNIGCAVKQLEWTEQFINQYGSFLQEEQYEDTIKLCKANLLFNQEQYEAVLQELLQVKFHNIFYGVQAKAIQLQAYYELNNYEESFFSLAKSFSTFLSRNKSLSDNQKQSFGNFILFTKKLKRVQNIYKPNTADLKNEIQNCTMIVYKNWLLNKINAL